MRYSSQPGYRLGAVHCIALLVALVAAGGATAQVVGGPGTVDQTTPLTCDNKPLAFHRHRARRILKREYRTTYYSTHETPSRRKIEGYQKHKRCIRHPGIRRDLGKQRKELARFQRRRIRATPYPGNGVYWAIPYYVVVCESGADYYPVGAYPEGGAYGLLASWHVRGGHRYAPIASEAEPWQQDLIADVAWRAGDSWACA